MLSVDSMSRSKMADSSSSSRDCCWCEKPPVPPGDEDPVDRCEGAWRGDEREERKDADRGVEDCVRDGEERSGCWEAKEVVRLAETDDARMEDRRRGETLE
jgi:hypothetical protein